ncbi:hypothetical protein KUCAC02_012094, partial [Chaenocephalus aceratus]
TTKPWRPTDPDWVLSAGHEVRPVSQRALELQELEVSQEALTSLGVQGFPILEPCLPWHDQGTVTADLGHGSPMHQSVARHHDQTRSAGSSPAHRPQSQAPPPAQDGLTKLFGFGASLLNQASTLINVDPLAGASTQPSPARARWCSVIRLLTTSNSKEPLRPNHSVWGALMRRVKWVALMPRVKWVALMPPLKWVALMRPLKWVALMPPVIWVALMHRVKWVALMPPVIWVALMHRVKWVALMRRVKWVAPMHPAKWGVLGWVAASTISEAADHKALQKQAPVVAPKPAPEPEKPKVNCPLCKTELNIGSSDPPNYNSCTVCHSQVCNLCGFNPTPHLVE